MSHRSRGPGLRRPINSSGAVARSQPARSSELLSPLPNDELDDIDMTISASQSKKRAPAAASSSSLRRSPSEQSATESERSASRADHDDDDESDDDDDEALEEEEEAEEAELEAAADADPEAEADASDDGAVAAAEAQVEAVADAQEEDSDADEEDDAIDPAPPSQSGFTKASSSSAAAAAAAAASAAPKAKAKAHPRSTRTKRDQSEEEEDDEDATDEDAAPTKESRTAKNGRSKTAASAQQKQPQRTPTKSRAAAAAPPSKSASSAGKSSSPAKSRSSAAASGHHAAAAASPAKPAKSGRQAAAVADDAMDDEQQHEEQEEEEEEKKGEPDAGDDSDAEAVMVDEEQTNKKRKGQQQKATVAKKKSRKTPSPDNLDIDDNDEPAPPAPRSPVASLLVARSAHAPHSPAISAVTPIAITPAPSASHDMSDGLGPTQAEGAPELLSSARQKLITTQMQSDNRAQQQEGLASLQTLFDDATPRAGTPSERAAISRASASKVPYAARLAKARFTCAEYISELIYRGKLNEDVARRAVDIMLEKLYLFSIEDCVFFLVQRLMMPWRVSQFVRHENRCSPAVALALFPPLVLRVTEEEDVIDCSRATRYEHIVPAHEFLQFLVGTMLEEPWAPSLLPDILNMLGDLNLSVEQTQLILEFVCQQCIPSIELDVLAAVCYRVWMLASHANAHEMVHEAILDRCESIARTVLEPYNSALASAGHSLSATQTGAAARQTALEKAKADKSTLDSVFISALLLWESAFAADPDLGQHLLAVLKERGLSTFACGMLFAMMRQSQWTRRCLDVLVDAFTSHLSVAHLATSHDTWLSQTMHAAKIEEAETTDPQQLVIKLLEAMRINPHPTLLPPIQTLGLTLIDAGAAMKGAHSADHVSTKHEVVDLTDDSPVGPGLINAGQAQLFELFQHFPDVRANLLQTVLSRIDGSASSSTSYILLLKRFTSERATAPLMARYSNLITSSLEWFHCLPSDIGLQFLHALVPLLRNERDVRDFVIRTVHKLLFHPSVDAQLLAVSSFFTLVKCRYNAIGAHSGGSSAFQASQRAASSASTGSSSADDEFFASNIGSLRRALDQPHLAVRIAVYQGLNRLFDQHPSLQIMILNLLFAHFRRYQVPRVTGNALTATQTPLMLRKALDPSEKRVVEPLPLLISTLQRMLMHQSWEHSSYSSSVSEGGLSQLDHVPEERRAGAHLRVQLDKLLHKFETAASLRELGINVMTLSDATVDDDAGVSAVLQAQVLHDVMAAFIEFSIVRDDADPHSPASSQASHHQAEVHDPSDPLSVPKMGAQRAQKLLAFFHLFWTLHELLTHPTAKTREAAGAPKKEPAKKPSKSKKKKGDMDDEEEEDEEEEEEEDEEEEDEDEDDDGGKKKKPASKKGGKGRKSSAGKAKGPAKAVQAMAKGWKQYHLSMGACIKLLKLSQRGAGAAIRASDSRIASSQSGAMTVGDALAEDDSLQKWLYSCCSNELEQWINRSDVAKTDVHRDLHSLAPFLTIIVKTNSSAVKTADSCTEKTQNSGGRKGQETLAYRIVSLVHQCFRCLRSVLGFGRQGDRLCEFLYAMLAPQNREKVNERTESGAVVHSLDKLLNWCIGMLEGHAKVLIEKRMFAEAGQVMDTLMLLAGTIKFGLAKHRELIIEKRTKWTGELCSRGVEDAALTGALLSYLWLVLQSVQNRDAALCDVVVYLRCQRTGEDIASFQDAPANQFTFTDDDKLSVTKAAATFCMARVRAAIDEVDVAISEARKSGKSAKTEQNVSVMMERLGFLNFLLTHLLSCSFEGTQADAVLRLVVKFFRTAVRAIKLVTAFSFKPSHKCMELVKGISNSTRPSLEDFMQWIMEQGDGDSSKKTKGAKQAKLKRQGTLFSHVSGSLEKWDNALLILSQKSGKCKEQALVGAIKRTMPPIDFKFEAQRSIKPEKQSPRKTTPIAAGNSGSRAQTTPRAHATPRAKESPLPKPKKPPAAAQSQSEEAPMDEDQEDEVEDVPAKAEPADDIEQ